MIQNPAVLDIIEMLDQEKIQYMISGSAASMYYGKPRMTHDVDMVIDVDFESAMKLYELAKGRFYISEEGINVAIMAKSMFNLIHNESGLKIDFWILTDSEFDRTRFERKQSHQIAGRSVYISTPEDTIIIKLVWMKETKYKKHEEDISDMLRLISGKLDFSYIHDWVTKLGLQSEAKMVKLSRI